ncbi:MAG: hypothetical protein J2P33_13145, partial [Actinobacteria bacterium]|nr:hypothetical protein [Actinomycetota bacterium]
VARLRAGRRGSVVAAQGTGLARPVRRPRTAAAYGTPAYGTATVYGTGDGLRHGGPSLRLDAEHGMRAAGRRAVPGTSTDQQESARRRPS